MYTKPKFIKNGDVRALVGWLDHPANHDDAANAVASAPEDKKDSALVDFIKMAPEFQGWDWVDVQDAVETANELELMESFKSHKTKGKKMSTTKKKLQESIQKAIRKGVVTAIQEAQGPKKRQAKVSQGQLQEAVKKAVKLTLEKRKARKLFKEMRSTEIVGYAVDNALFCRDHMSAEEAEADESVTPVFSNDEGWEERPCDDQSEGPHNLGDASAFKEGVSTGEGTQRGRASFGTLPSADELDSAIEELGGWSMDLRGEDARAFEDAMDSAGIALQSAKTMMNTGRGMHKILTALTSTEDANEDAASLASSIMDVLGWEWI